MKKALAVFAFFAATVCALNAQTVATPASDSRITYIGRTLSEGDNVSFDWSATTVKVSFTGTYLAMKASDTHKDYFDVWMDKTTDQTPDKVISTFGKDSTIVLFSEADFKDAKGRISKAAAGAHNVIIRKRTEGEQGKTTISAFLTKGELIQAEGLKSRMIEFVGDSYTCGYGTESHDKNDPFTPETENSNLTYAAIIARYFDADHITVAHSGQGMARNFGDFNQGYCMPERYLQTFDMDKNVIWDASKSAFKPAMTVIYLCTNDFCLDKQPSMGAFTRQYIKLIKQIKSNYGENHPILCIAGRADLEMTDYIRAVVEKCGYMDVAMMTLSGFVNDFDSDLGASWHPNYVGQQKKAYAIIPYISTLTGWSLEDKPVK